MPERNQVTREKKVKIFVPASIGNVGPGFDVLGLCVDGLGDEFEIQLTGGPDEVVTVTGLDADQIPREPAQNASIIAAKALLKKFGIRKQVRVSIHRRLPLSGGLGGSAAAAVGGALGAAMAASLKVKSADIFAAALVAESFVAGPHLDNIAPCLLGGLTLVRDVGTLDVLSLKIKARWWLALVTPDIFLETKKARSVLPQMLERHEWVAQMANTAAMMIGFSQGDKDTVRRSLVDLFAEPRRAPLIPKFSQVKTAALAAGAMGCSISGAGPTVFALCPTKEVAHQCRQAMEKAFAMPCKVSHVGAIGLRGAYVMGSSQKNRGLL